MKTIISIAKKEFFDGMRNYEIIALAIFFALVPSMIALLATDGKVAINYIKGLAAFMIPIVGLVLGYASIASEVERGSMGALLSYPVSRDEVVIGKIVGLASIIVVSILSGLIISGLVIFSNTSYDDVEVYLLLIFASILLGLVFLNLAIAFSSFVRSSNLALISAAGIWIFFNAIWNFIIMALKIASTEKSTVIGGSSTPEWIKYFEIISPVNAYLYINNSDPTAPSVSIIILSLIIWVIVPIIFAILLFRRREM